MPFTLYSVITQIIITKNTFLQYFFKYSNHLLTGDYKKKISTLVYNNNNKRETKDLRFMESKRDRVIEREKERERVSEKNTHIDTHTRARA